MSSEGVERKHVVFNDPYKREIVYRLGELERRVSYDEARTTAIWVLEVTSVFAQELAELRAAIAPAPEDEP